MCLQLKVLQMHLREIGSTWKMTRDIVLDPKTGMMKQDVNEQTSLRC
jgi:hypothetical protein